MEQLNANQIAKLRALLGPLGVEVKAKAKPRAGGDELSRRIAEVTAMKFKTAGVKASILKTLKTLKASREFHAAHPGDLTDLLALFGVRLQDVNPWPAERWQCIVNGLPGMVSRLPLALPKPSPSHGFESFALNGVMADAAAPLRRIVCTKGHREGNLLY